MKNEKLFNMPYGKLYELYLAKILRKEKEKEDLDKIIRWLTGYDQVALEEHMSKGTSLKDFLLGADYNPLSELIQGKICGVRIETIEDPLMKQVRQLDKLVDELARGRKMDKILRHKT